MNILLANAHIDFYIPKKKYESYKTSRGRKNFILIKLSEELKNLKGKVINGITLRDVSITSNGYWGQEPCFINDLNYSVNNEVEETKREDTLVVRLFAIDVVGVTKEHDTLNCFFEMENETSYLSVGSVKIV